MFVQDESEFQKLIETVDEHLKNRNIPIHARPIQAVIEIAKLLKIKEIPLVPIKYADNSETAEIVSRIHNWYEIRYSNRLKIHLGPGSVAILIKGDPWQIIFPRFYGKVMFVCDPALEKYRELPKIATNKPIVYNMLLCIKDLTNEISNSLTNKELENIFEFFIFALNVLESLYQYRGLPFLAEAKSDLEIAVSNIVSNHPNFGISKWSSLQFAEKTLKSFLKTKSIQFPFTHDLSALLKLTKTCGLTGVEDKIAEKIQCNPDIRYQSRTVTLEDAVSAHHSALDIFAKCFPKVNL